MRTQRSIHPLVYPLKVFQISIRLSRDTCIDKLCSQHSQYCLHSTFQSLPKPVQFSGTYADLSQII